MSPAETPSEGAHPDRRDVEEPGRIRARTAGHLPEGRVPDEVDAEQRNLHADAGEEREALDAGRERERLLEAREVAVGRFRDAPDLGDLVARAPLQRLEGGAEGPHRGFPREIDGDDDRDSEGDRGQREERPGPVPGHGADDEAEEENGLGAHVSPIPRGGRQSARGGGPHCLTSPLQCASAGAGNVFGAVQPARPATEPSWPPRGEDRRDKHAGHASTPPYRLPWG